MQSRWEIIRHLADQVRGQYAQKANQAGLGQGYLDVRAVAEEVFQLEARRDGYLPANVYAVLDPEGQAIRVHPSFDELMTRFLIGHELGHAKLEGLSEAVVDHPQHANPDVAGLFETEQDVLRGYNTRERREQEANLFAVELLVPAALLWKDLQQQDWNEVELATRYGVPKEAIQSQIINVCFYPPQTINQIARPPRSITLDSAQQDAVMAPLPTLVLAGPGSGKTRTMVKRYRALLEEGIDPQRILVLTFSNKAAEELRGRILGDLPPSAAQQVGNINVFTFHAFGLELIRQYYQHLGLQPDVTLLTPGELYILCKRHLDLFPLDIFKSLNWPSQNLPDLLHRVSRAKEELITPERYMRFFVKHQNRKRSQIEALLADRLAKNRDKGESQQREIEKLHELGLFYTAYQQLLQSYNVLDFGDLVMLPVQLLQRSQEVATEVRHKYQYILVDEYQDINYANGKLIRALDGGRQQVWAVGDLCQGIYRFRGATPVHIQRFTKVYSRATPIFLDRNYRSLGPVVRASDAQIQGTSTAVDRPLMKAVRRRKLRQAVQEIVATSESQELETIAQTIKKLITPRIGWRSRHGQRIGHVRPSYNYGDIAILCRKHEHATAVTAALRTQHIPVEYVGKLLDLPVCKDLLALCTLTLKGDRSGLLRVLTTDDFHLSQADLDVLQPDGVASVGGLWHILSKHAEVNALSEQGHETITRLAGVVADLNTHPTPWHMLVRYLFHHSQFFREQLAVASSGDFAALRTVQQVGQLLTLARSARRPSLVVDDMSPAGFVRYIRELEEAGHASRVPPLQNSTPVVQVMTAHSSKGLEFPVVFIPYLADGCFPPKEPPSPAVPRLDWLAWGGAGDRDEEERHLCYVAMSRAKDRLFLLRSINYDGKTCNRSPLLPDQPPWQQHSLAADEHTIHVKTPTEGRLLPIRGPLPPIPDRALERYQKCPRRYLYQEVYGLYGHSRPTSRIYRCIREAIDRVLTHIEVTGTIPTDEEKTAIIDNVWADVQLDNIPYQADYRAMVQAQVLASVERRTGPEVTVESFRTETIALLDEGEVVFHIDQIEQRADGPVFLLAFAGEPKDDHAREARTILAAHVYEQRYGGKPRIERYYPGMAPIPVSHRKDTVPSRIAAMNDALRGIKAREFPARPETHQCKICPFNLICAV